MAGRPWSDRGGHDWPARLRNDAELRDELEVCERAGIGHSVFLAWDEDDQDKAVSYLRWKNQCCQGCGVHPSEWPDDPYEAEQDPPFEARLSSCFGCQMTTGARKEIPSEQSMAVRVRLIPRKRDADKSPEELEAEAEAWAAADEMAG